ncbi:Ribosomal protein L7Ae [Clostridium sp. USBA 49]|jgi:ribosomal protein L7Ae-like RNA K-turn-binding protein|uniref:ribosomal L7Ae/L30e/S12e/Gadd45 family protein n=1 Tax=Clostridium TaxID=1485 RepID=UPI00099A1E5C|nr:MULTISPECIES: ribosomal L7Ae/L30e/S12e/Gadd45 family protein [Clostridium]SKA76488.1 Ribosomal protein L7Ae [Clostridium sp. USBA 49]
MKNDFLQFLGLIKKAGKLIEGYNKCEDAIKKDILHFIIISNDCSENTKNKFINYCNKFNINYIQRYSKEELGNILGRKEINILGVTDKNMSDKLLKIINKG